VLLFVLLITSVALLLEGCSKSKMQSEAGDQISSNGIETTESATRSAASRQAWRNAKAANRTVNVSQGKTMPVDVTGSVIHFGIGAGAERYCVSGWSAPEEHFVWTEGKVATLTLPIYARPDSLLLRLKAKGVINPPEVNFQPVDVFADGKKVAEWKVTGL